MSCGFCRHRIGVWKEGFCRGYGGGGEEERVVSVAAGVLPWIWCCVKCK